MSSCDLRGSGTLIIVILKARNLPNRRKLDKQNPYAICRIANIVDRTPSITRGGQTPEWNHESRFSLNTDINPLLKISVLDETKKSPVLIGDAEIDCSPVFNTTSDEGYDKWHPLQYAGRTAGEIYVEMTFYPTAPVEPVKKKGAVTLHRNTVRPLPNRPGEEESFVEEEYEYDNNFLEDDNDSFRPSVRSNQTRSVYEPPRGRSLYNSSQDSHNFGEFEVSNSFFDDSIAKQIIRENPEKFQQLLARNPDFAQSIIASQYGKHSLFEDSFNQSRKSHSVSPIRNPYLESPTRSMKSINASFDDLEKEVQTDYYRNKLGTSRYSQYMKKGNSRSPINRNEPEIDHLKISTILPKLPEFNGSRYSEYSAPIPPPHKSVSSKSSGESQYSTGSSLLTSASSVGSANDQQTYYSRKSFSPFPKKKAPPPSYNEEEEVDEFLASKFNGLEVSGRSW